MRMVTVPQSSKWMGDDKGDKGTLAYCEVYSKLAAYVPTYYWVNKDVRQ